MTPPIAVDESHRREGRANNVQECAMPGTAALWGLHAVLRPLMTTAAAL